MCARRRAVAFDAGLAEYTKLMKAKQQAPEYVPCKFLAVNKYLFMEKGQTRSTRKRSLEVTIGELIVDELLHKR